jgi:hypothetical protein
MGGAYTPRQDMCLVLILRAAWRGSCLHARVEHLSHGHGRLPPLIPAVIHCACWDRRRMTVWLPSAQSQRPNDLDSHKQASWTGCVYW